MKSKGYSFLLLLSLFLPANVAVIAVDAHPASSIVLNYDLEVEILEVTAFHSVWNIESHYINQITVELNGELTVSRNYFRQSSRAAHYDQFNISALEGDTIVVNTTCNEGGELSAMLTVGAVNTDDEGFWIVLVLSGVALFLVTTIALVRYLRRSG